MKILIVSDAWHPQINGVVRTYEYLIKELNQMGHEVRVIGPSDFRFSVPMPGYAEIRLVPFAYGRLRRMIMDHNPDLLHIATEGPLGWAAWRYAVSSGKDFTTCYHTQFPEYSAKRIAKYLPFMAEPVRKFSIWVLRRFHNASSCLLVSVDSLTNTLKGWNFECPIKPMTRGIDTEIFYPGEKNLFRNLKKPIALYVGRIAIEKNLESFLSIPWEGSKIIVGSGPDEDMLKNKYPDAHFTGVKKGKDLADHYRSADLFIFPSKTDTFGMVLVEAMACGLPIAAYPVTGPMDIVTESFLGSLNDDLSAAAKNALQCGLTEQRVTHAKKHYSWRKAALQFLEEDAS